MEAKNIKKLLLQLAKGEAIDNQDDLLAIQEILGKDEEVRELLEHYKSLHQNNELHLLDSAASLNRIQNKALINALKDDAPSVENKNKAAARLVTNQDFRNRYQEEFPLEEGQTKVRSLHPVIKYTLRIAATLTLLLVAWWFTGQAMVYREAMAAYEQFEQEQSVKGAIQLGGDDQMTGSVCSIIEQFDQASERKSFIYIPEGGVKVAETGTRFGVKFYVIQEGGCELTVLVKTDGKLPEVGEKVSFDARAFEVKALGQALRVLVEEQRHIIY